MKNYISFIFCALVLSACAPDNLAASMPVLEGKPVSQVVRYLGTPTEKIKTEDMTTYAWVSEERGRFDVPEDSPVAVVRNGPHPTVTFIQQRPSIADTYDWYCRLDITAQKGVITEAHYDGNTAGCRKFSDKLKPLTSSK